jgi:NADPH:quinone reductase-like Zn-dependent oxidoreductase
MARFLKGRRVACAAAAPDIAGGMWAEYLVTSAQLCVPFTSGVMNKNGAAFQSVATRRFDALHEAPSTRTWPLGGVRVGSVVLKVLGAFWDTLEGSRRRPQA